MCRIYAATDPRDYQPVTRSLRLHGVVTSIRLEARFWAILGEMAEAEGITTPRFLAKLHDEVIELHGEVRNFASLLRVVCTAFLAGDGPLARSRPTERSIGPTAHEAVAPP